MRPVTKGEHPCSLRLGLWKREDTRKHSIRIPLASHVQCIEASCEGDRAAPFSENMAIV